jgi:hypothetical protein
LKAKSLLKEKKINFNIINCDEYIIEDKEFFLSFIKDLTNKEVKTFPMIFYDNQFIGGYNETTEFVKGVLLAFDDDF